MIAVLLALAVWDGPWWAPHQAPYPPPIAQATWIEFVQAPCGLPLVREARDACHRRRWPVAGVAIEAMDRNGVCAAKVTCLGRF